MIDDALIDIGDLPFAQAMQHTGMAMSLADPHAVDCPLVYVNDAYLRLTGYRRDEVLGRNCRFLQGPGTSPEAVDHLRAALRTRSSAAVELLNFKKDGTPFWNALQIGPIFDARGALRYYLGAQLDVTRMQAGRAAAQIDATVDAELRHRIKNIFAVVSGIVTVSGRREGAPDLAARIVGRINALARSFEVMRHAGAEGATLRAVVSSILSAYDEAADRIEIVGDDRRVSATTLSTLALVMHELAANALKYGALRLPDATLAVSWSGDATLVFEWVERGVWVQAPPQGDGTGLGIVEMLVQSSGGRFLQDWLDDGVHMRIELPHI